MDNLKVPLREESLDVRELLLKFAAYWHWFLVSVLLCMAGAFMINYISVPVYEVRTTVLVEEGKSMLDDRFSSTMGISNSSNQLGNQMDILKSYSLTKRAIQRLSFRISYFQKNNFILRELYKASPFQVVLDTLSPFPIHIPVYITINSPTEYTVYADAESGLFYHFMSQKVTGPFKDLKVDAAGKLFRPFHSKTMSFTVIPNSQTDLKGYIGKQFYFVVNDDNSLVRQYRSIKVQDSKTSSVLSVSMQGENVPKMVDFLNALTFVYIEKGVEKKNQIAENTIRFIDSQLGDVADSLYFSEKTLQDYQTAHSIMDVNFQAQQVFTSVENLKNQRAELVVKGKYYEYIYKYLKENDDAKNLIAPSSLGISDIVLSSLVNELINLYNERTELGLNSIRENPYLASNEQRINNLRQSVLRNIENLSTANKISLQDIDKRIDEISSKGNKLPETQRNLIGYERKFKLNDALYTYLLTKRSEMQIAKASNIPDNDVVDKATSEEYAPISPKKNRNYFIALLWGLGIPTAFLLLRDYFNNKIQKDDDIKAICDFPILGHIVRSKENVKTVVADFPMSPTAESIRAIRTNFQFVVNGQGKNTFLFTSSIQGEGKSFSTLNTALSLAMYKKKTILLNFDLRRPKLQDYLGVNSEIGLSSYLSGNIQLEDIILKTKYDYLDTISAGAIPPNPMELIASEYTKTLFRELKQKYDYILIDSPPIGMVADALLLIEFADVTIFVVRQGYTPKKVFSQLMENLEKRNINHNLNIVLNDISMDRRHQPYSYGYSYGYGYTFDKKPKSMWKRRKV
jgi:tyrosine-protein kinase Etk/Wzc